MNLRIMLFAVIMLFCFSCGDDDDQMQTVLEGEWIWQSSTGGIAGAILTPDTENFTQEVRFEGNKFEQFRDGESFAESDFEIMKGESIFSIDSADIIMYANQDLFPQFFYFIGNDTLTLQDEVFDGFNHIYFRK